MQANLSDHQSELYNSAVQLKASNIYDNHTSTNMHENNLPNVHGKK